MSSEMLHSAQNIERYLSDNHFLDWVKRPNASKDAYWKNFLEQHPEESEWVEQARAIVEMTLAHDKPNPSQYLQIKTALWQKLDEPTEAIETPQMRPLWRNMWIQVAASVVLLIGFFWFYIKIDAYNEAYKHNVAQVKKEQNQWTEIYNGSLQTQLVVLPDRSTVVLQPQSRIGYMPTFEGNAREVVLSGKAFFEIEKNPNKPFIVHANEVITKVLGTSFTVDAFATEKQVVIKVKTGKVAVCSQNDAHVEDFLTEQTLGGMVLGVNEQASYDRNTHTFAKLTEVAKKQRLFEFEEIPVTKVFQAIEKDYNVDIVVDEELIEHCTITASLGNQHLFNKLDIICRVIQARYELVNGKIVVYAQKCSH